MLRATLVLLGLPIGAVAGWLVGRLPVSAAAQSIAAALLASAVTTVATASFWAWWSVDEMGVRAVTIDLSRGAACLIVVAIAAAALHFTLGWASQVVHPALSRHRPITIGLAVGVVSALMVGAAVATIETL